MRIIVTNNGKHVLKKLYSSNSCPDLFNNQSHSVSLRNNNPLLNNANVNQDNTNIINQRNIENNNNHIISVNEESKLPLFSNYNSHLLSSNNSINSMSPKIVKIKEKNFKIPISFLKKYEKKDNDLINNKIPIVTQSLTVLTALENNLSKNKNSNNINNNIIEESYSQQSNSRLFSGNSNSSLPKIRSHYSIGEIINKKCFDKLNKKIKDKIEEQKYDLKVDIKNLRKYSNSKQIFDEINKEKNKSIDASNYKLIEYLMKKTSISKSFLKKLNECDDEKLTHLNKISGKVLIEKENQLNYNKRIKEKLKQQKIKETLQFRKILFNINNEVNNNVKNFHMNNYPLTKDNNKVVYRNVFRKFRRKYWKKSDNFSRFFPKYQRVHYEEL
jgi:hypothetical protein